MSRPEIEFATPSGGPTSPAPPYRSRSAEPISEPPISGAKLKSVQDVAPVSGLMPVLVEAVLPVLLSRRGNVRRFLPRVSPDADRLARLLLDDDITGADGLIRRVYARAGSLAPLCATVIEPAARSLGDLWSTDDCTETAMTLALCRLQAALLQVTHETASVAIRGPVVLIAPQPGEVHALGGALDAEVLCQAGWETHREFPDTDEALRTMLAADWFDVLDLSLSPAMRREGSLPEMAVTIAGARLASRNPALTVVVGGRAFFENAEASNAVGADASTSSALHVVLAVARALQKTATEQATRGVLVTTS